MGLDGLTGVGRIIKGPGNPCRAAGDLGRGRVQVLHVVSMSWSRMLLVVWRHLRGTAWLHLEL